MQILINIYENRIIIHHFSPLCLKKTFILHKIMERLSVSLDEESQEIIKNYLPKYKGSKANLIRRALEHLKDHEEIQKKVDFDDIKIYIDFLARMEHVIVDIAHWKAIFSEIDKGSEKFWNEVYDIGVEHWKEYSDKGLINIQKILEYVEKTNWYKLNVDSETSFTLILSVSEASKFVSTFFKGFFSRHSRTIEITEEFKKIRIRVV